MNFFSLRYLKNKDYVILPENLNHLPDRINKEVNERKENPSKLEQRKGQ